MGRDGRDTLVPVGSPEPGFLYCTQGLCSLGSFDPRSPVSAPDLGLRSKSRRACGRSECPTSGVDKNVVERDTEGRVHAHGRVRRRGRGWAGGEECRQGPGTFWSPGLSLGLNLEASST